jgi:hypothetical protein
MAMSRSVSGWVMSNDSTEYTSRRRRDGPDSPER